MIIYSSASSGKHIRQFSQQTEHFGFTFVAVYAMQRLLISFLLLCMSLAGYAQVGEMPADTVALPEHVKIFKDPRLDVLEKRPPLMAKLELEEKNRIPVYKPIVSADGKKKVTGSIYTTKGFRIVIYNGADRKQAIDAKNKFSKIFAGQRSYMSYNVPSYKIKVGDFEGKADANEYLRKVSKFFPSSFIVPDIITVKNINVTE